MRYSSALVTAARIISVLTAAHCLRAQTPAVLKGAQGLPPRATPADYQVQAKAGTVTIAAEFTGHGVPTSLGALNTEDFVAVEIGLFGPPDARLTIAAADFSLKINGKKTPLPSQPYGLVAKSIKDPEWVPPEGVPEKKSKGSMGGSGGGAQGESSAPPPPPKPPIELLRSWQQRLQKSAIAEGDRALPQAGLIFFQYRGKAENIRTVELIYEGSAGTATLALQ